jgi:hypothetical protein
VRYEQCDCWGLAIVMTRNIIWAVLGFGEEGRGSMGGTVGPASLPKIGGVSEVVRLGEDLCVWQLLHVGILVYHC